MSEYRKTYNLGSAEAGSLLMCSVCSNCSDTFLVKLLCGRRGLAVFNKNDEQWALRSLGQVSVEIQVSGGIVLDVEFGEHSLAVCDSLVRADVTDDHGNAVGHTCTVSFGYWKDALYSNAVLTVTVLKKRF